MRLLVPLLVLGAALAGCLQSAPTSPASTTFQHATLPDLSDVAAPQIDTARARMWWEDFVKNHPERVTGSPTNIQASGAI